MTTSFEPASALWRPGDHRTGDGSLSAFDSPARAIRCAQAICAAIHGIGLGVRAGVHSGEFEVLGDHLGGIAVHIGARISALAGPDEVLSRRPSRRR